MKIRMIVLRFGRDHNGGVLVEATIMMSILFMFVLGSVDFLFAFYQWNAAAKAVQVGARIAAVSDPVAIGLNGLSAGVVSASVPPPAARCRRSRRPVMLPLPPAPPPSPPH